MVELLVVLREHAIDDELGTHRSAATRRATYASREDAFIAGDSDRFARVHL